MERAKSLIINDDHQDGSAVRLALVQHGSKPARGLSRAEQPGNFDSGRKPRLVQLRRAQAGLGAA